MLFEAKLLRSPSDPVRSVRMGKDSRYRRGLGDARDLLLSSQATVIILLRKHVKLR
jgi:hypothetical protein